MQLDKASNNVRNLEPMERGLFINFLVRTMTVAGILLIFAASQLFWIRRLGELAQRLIPSQKLRRLLGGGAIIAYALLFVYNLVWAQMEPGSTHLTFRAALLEAPFRWWATSSLLGFALIVAFWCADRAARAARWLYRKIAGAALAPRLQSEPAAFSPLPDSPGRRRFLERTALAVGAAPFAACAYGFFYERHELEVTRRRIHLARLPGAFNGFRIAQLSDIHIGPFMTRREISKYVSLANSVQPELIVLTGDYVTWDPTTQWDAVDVLSNLKAPFGVFGCLGNHELWTGTQVSITDLFAQAGIRILRLARAPLTLHGETLNLIGVDYQIRTMTGRRGEGLVGTYLPCVEPLVRRDTANILLSHNPNTFDRAAELGIDLSLAGHTHGGQVTLEYVSPNISPARLITNYVRGWFEKPGAQLYVNRGIGTIGVPIRLGAPPEITVFELERA